MLTFKSSWNRPSNSVLNLEFFHLSLLHNLPVLIHSLQSSLLHNVPSSCLQCVGYQLQTGLALGVTCYEEHSFGKVDYSEELVYHFFQQNTIFHRLQWLMTSILLEFLSTFASLVVLWSCCDVRRISGRFYVDLHLWMRLEFKFLAVIL